MINLKFAEKFFIITIFFSVLFSFFFKSFNQDAYLSNLLVLFNALLFVFLLIPVVVKNNNARLLIVVFLCLRIFLLYLDYYGKDIANVLHSGGDSERFHQFGLIISKNLNMMNEISYTKYTDFLGILYWIIGDQRFFSQFLNVVIGMWSIFIFYKILDLFKLKDSKKLFFLALYGFYPQNIIFSSILLREALILFFFIYSMLFFIQWLRSNSRIHIYKTIIFVLLSAVFHPGMLLGLLVYGFMFLFLDIKNHRFRYSFKRKTLFILVVGLAISLILYNTSILTGKFAFLLLEQNTSLIDAYQSGSAVEKGGATYLSNFQINSVTDLIFLTPLRLIYFIFSPMPYDIRGFGDIAAIVLDSSFFYFLFYSIVRKRRIINGSVFKIFPKIFIILFLIVALGFAIGTENSGTAMRHRTKIFPILMIVVVFIESMNQDKLSIWNDKTND
tara:strand:- start:1943 stop:3274 length:1332 start_codon:yes stop_codon:yes gene_type:complete